MNIMPRIHFNTFLTEIVSLSFFTPCLRFFYSFQRVTTNVTSQEELQKYYFLNSKESL
jgi:hypothetical protein